MTIWTRPKRFAPHPELERGFIPGAARELLDVWPVREGGCGMGTDLPADRVAYIRSCVRRYYLPFVGVDPGAERGMGAALLIPVLAECDRDGIAALPGGR